MAADPLTKRTVDDILNDNDDLDWDDEIFGEKPSILDRDDKSTLSPRKRKADDDKENHELGLDEEVKIVKKRKPIAKLDVERLLSQPGIPKLREIVRSGHVSKKLRLKGRGHEFSDAGRLLNYYQLWLDNLYPRAKFADALQLVEKAGHQKRMQVMRKAWIDESKPGYARDKALMEELAQQEKEVAAQDAKQEAGEQLGRSVPVDNNQDENDMFFDDGDFIINKQRDDGPDEDELDALLAQESHYIAPKPKQQDSHESDSEGEDDLDALLAEHEHRAKPKASAVEEDEEDELDALLNEHESIRPTITPKTDVKISNRIDEVRRDEEDELDALLAEQNNVPEPELPNMPSESARKIDEQKTVEKPLGSEEVPDLINTISSSPIPNVETDDLDRLMDEHDAAKRKEQETGMDEHFLSSSPIPNTESQ